MSIAELPETPPKPVNVAVIERVLRDLGLPLGNTTVQVVVDFEHSQIVVHKLAIDDHGRTLPNWDGGRTYWATYKVTIPINQSA